MLAATGMMIETAAKIGAILLAPAKLGLSTRHPDPPRQRQPGFSPMPF